MNIIDIFSNVEYKVLQKSNKNEFIDMNYDSRLIKENHIFVALKGLNLDGHDYVFDAYKKGVSMIIAEREDIELSKDIHVILVKNLRQNLGKIAANFYNHQKKS